MPTQDLSNFFVRPTPEELNTIVKQLEEQPGFKEAAQQVPEDLKASLAKATPEFLAGYIAGQDHTMMALYSSSQAIAQGNEPAARVIQQRRDIITLLVCRQLLGKTSNIILLH